MRVRWNRRRGARKPRAPFRRRARAASARELESLRLFRRLQPGRFGSRPGAEARGAGSGRGRFPGGSPEATFRSLPGGGETPGRRFVAGGAPARAAGFFPSARTTDSSRFAASAGSSSPAASTRRTSGAGSTGTPSGADATEGRRRSARLALDARLRSGGRRPGAACGTKEPLSERNTLQTWRARIATPTTPAAISARESTTSHEPPSSSPAAWAAPAPVSRTSELLTGCARFGAGDSCGPALSGADGSRGYSTHSLAGARSSP
jgi:hypothetical protein